MDWFLMGIRKYALFGGRSRRKEFWYYCLFGYLIGVALYIVDINIGTVDSETKLGLLCGLYTLMLWIPNIAIGMRRLHDVGKSGSWLWLLLLPVIGSIILTVWWSMDSQPGDNRYGANPKPNF